MPTTLGIQISLTGTITISDVTPITAPTFVDWWTWGSAGTGVAPKKSGDNVTASSLANRVSQALDAGQHMFVTYHLDAVGTVFTVGGVAATLIGSNFGTNATENLVQIWTYDVPSAGTYDIDIAPSSGTSLNRMVSIFKADDAATVTAQTTLPVSSVNTYVVGITATINNNTYAPDTTSSGAITTHVNFDIRSNEDILVRQYDDLDADITADADYAGDAASWSGIWAILS